MTVVPLWAPGLCHAWKGPCSPPTAFMTSLDPSHPWTFTSTPALQLWVFWRTHQLCYNYKPRKWRARNALYVDDYPGLFLNCRIHLCKYYWWFSKFSPHLIYVLGFFFLLQWQGKFFSLGILIWRFWLNLVYSSEKKNKQTWKLIWPLSSLIWEEFRPKMNSYAHIEQKKNE